MPQMDRHQHQDARPASAIPQQEASNDEGRDTRRKRRQSEPHAMVRLSARVADPVSQIERAVIEPSVPLRGTTVSTRPGTAVKIRGPAVEVSARDAPFGRRPCVDVGLRGLL